jgi:dephospho-CoA kinase
MIVGITGGIGSGKTTVVELFKKLGGIAVYIADEEAKKLMSSSKNIKERMMEAFGKEAYKKGTLNTAYISKIVFSNKKKLTILNNIVHPEVYKHFDEFCNQNLDKEYILYENAILFENKSDVLCDFIITATTDELLKTARILKRDHCTKEEVAARMKNQWADDKKIMQSNYIIENNNIENTTLQTAIIHNKLTKKSI